MKLTYEMVKHDDAINSYIKRADETLSALNYTEHSFAHVTKVANDAGRILTELGYPDHEVEMAKIAGYLHDIGNVINRIDHAQSGAVMAFRLLDKMGGEPDEISTIITAIGNHDESTAFPVNPVAAALIIADKSDVRYTRVRAGSDIQNDIHDRVNFAVRKSSVLVDKDSKVVTLDLEIDTTICKVMDYFEIFMSRMLLCRKAAEKLGAGFGLIINGQQIM